MTAGSSILRSITWPGKFRKRKRSGLGGSEDVEKDSEKREGRKRRTSGLSLQSITSIFSSKEQFSSPDQTKQFKCSWPVKNMLKKAESSGGQGLDSKHFKIQLNGVSTVWNLSIRFWTNEQGEKIFNPFLFCLNLIESKSTSDDPVEVTYKFNMFNRALEKYDEGPEGVASVVLDGRDQIQSVGVENVALKDDNFNDDGDILLQISVSFNWQSKGHENTPKMPKYLEQHQNPPDLLVVSGSRLFPVHRQVLAAASPVLARLVEGLKTQEEEPFEQINSNRPFTPQFSSDLSETNELLKDSEDKPVDKIVIPTLPPAIVETILTYIYSGDTPGDLSSPELLRACMLYQLPGLQSLCEEHLATLLTPSTVASLLLLADTSSSHRLKERALQYCREQCAYIIKDQDWSVMEQDNHRLWVEACRQVETDGCKDHGKCVKNTRYLMETKMMEQCVG